MKFNTISDKGFEGKSILLRLDLNVPIKDRKIIDENRIQASLPTLRYLIDQKAKVVIVSHLGRPKGKASKDLSLAPIGERLAELLDVEVILVDDYHKEPADQLLSQLTKHQIIMYENVRFNSDETSNDMDFARQLMKGIDYYINDAFGTVHRAHTSVVAAPKVLAKDKRLIGFLMEEELKALSKIKVNNKAPFVVVIGGAKVSDKIGVLLKLIESCNHVLVGGAMAYTLLKFQGYDVGTSKVEDDKEELVASIFRTAESRKVQIHLPVDHIGANEFKASAKPHIVEGCNIPKDLMGLDIGPKTVRQYREVIRSANTVLWNGPMGVFEWDAFAQGSLGIAAELANCAAYSVVGGGESVAAIQKAGVKDQISHVSTGGGASLEFLEGLSLPGLKALEVDI